MHIGAFQIGEGPALFVLIAAIVGVVAIFSWIAAEKRRKALAEFAYANGLSFSPSASGVYERYEAFRPFGNGHSRRASNHISGRRGDIDWDIFDYKYVTGSGKHRQTHKYGIIAAKVPIGFPGIQIRPEGIFDKLAAIVGFDDIDFESEEFSRRYCVKSHDRKKAYDLIHPEMMEYLLSIEPCDWQWSGRYLVLHRGRHYDPESIARMMQYVEGVLARVPAFLREDLGMRASSFS